MLKVLISFDEGIPVVRLTGRFDGFGATEFEKATRELRGGSDKAPAYWVIDFGGVDYLSSAGIRALVGAEKSLRTADGRLVLVAMNPMLEGVLDASGLLGEFLCAPDLTAGLALARNIARAGQPVHRVIGGVGYELTPLAGEKPTLELWGTADWITRRKEETQDLVAVRLSELGFALGIGGLGINAQQAAEGLGEFVAAGALMGVLPADEHGEPDFVLTARPDEATAYLAVGVSFRGAPSARLNIAQSGGQLTLGDLGNGLAELLASGGESAPPTAGFVLVAEPRRLVGKAYPTPGKLAAGAGIGKEQAGGACPVLLVGLVGDCSRLDGEAVESSLGAYLCHGAGEAGGCGVRIHAHAFQIENLSPDFTRDDPKTALQAIADPDSLRGVLHLAPETELAWARGWLYVPRAIRPGAEGRLRIEWPRDYQYPDEWDTIIRRIYHDASRVVVTPLHGGFTATTLQITSYDAEGRQMLPTVLKLGPVEMGRQEEAACREYVQKYILNNGTVILGTAIQGNHMGVRYNFVGINGPESRLTWLREHYQRRPSRELIPIFDRIFTEILKPWYGQPRWERVRLFEEHNPAGYLFPNLLADAQREMNLSLDEPTLQCPFIARPLPNPYYVLKHIYSKRRAETMLWYTGICHGDLNMQNILLDERENLYIIDFSETRPRNIVSDFARLEPIFLFETLRLDTDDDIRRALEFIESLYNQTSLADTPEFVYSGDDPMVRKAYDLIQRLRHYANIVTLFETQMLPYWLAVLEWCLPVASYRGLPPRRKQLALYTSALLCEQALK